MRLGEPGESPDPLDGVEVLEHAAEGLEVHVDGQDPGGTEAERQGGRVVNAAEGEQPAGPAELGREGAEVDTGALGSSFEHVAEVPDVITQARTSPGDPRWDHASEHHDIRVQLLGWMEAGGSG